jgi:hypothetical protein
MRKETRKRGGGEDNCVLFPGAAIIIITTKIITSISKMKEEITIIWIFSLGLCNANGIGLC